MAALGLQLASHTSQHLPLSPVYLVPAQSHKCWKQNIRETLPKAKITTSYLFILSYSRIRKKNCKLGKPNFNRNSAADWCIGHVDLIRKTWRTLCLLCCAPREGTRLWYLPVPRPQPQDAQHSFAAQPSFLAWHSNLVVQHKFAAQPQFAAQYELTRHHLCF